MQTHALPVADLVTDPNNARAHDDRNLEAITASLKRFGQQKPIVVNGDNVVVAGNGTLAAALALGWDTIQAVRTDLVDGEAVLYAIADNRTAELAAWNAPQLELNLMDLDIDGGALDAIGWTQPELDALFGNGEQDDEVQHGSMTATFGAPPVTLLDSRQGYWQERKRAWLAQGIASLEGRATDLISNATERSSFGGDWDASKGENAWGGSGTSVFDPVLAELMVRWFSPEGGTVLDPFAGGSVRGVVSAMVGRNYTGIDLRPEQVAANRKQWATIQATQPSTKASEDTTQDPDAITPIQQVGDLWLKRDDLFQCNGANGGKVRTIMRVAKGARGIITCGARQSTMLSRAAQVAQHLDIGCRVHTAQGKETDSTTTATTAGAEVVRHKAGYLSVVKKRAKDDAANSDGWVEIPWAGECQENIEQAAAQVPQALPEGVKRIVVCCGSGMSMAGILWGLKRNGIDCPVLGVMVGADPMERLNRWAPKGWHKTATLVPSGEKYETEIHASVGPVELDPVYEAKCVPHLQPGDMLWIVGHRNSAPASTVTGSATWVEGDSATVLATADTSSYDMVLSCPPYGDLEVYSDDPEDLSTMSHDQFFTAYRAIIAAAVERMAPDSFAAWVVGDYRDKRGLYRNFVGDTITAFLDAGASLYNEAIYVTPMGSLPLRAGRIFQAGRKLGKTHQNVLVFVKGAPKRAAVRCGPVDLKLEADEVLE